MASDGNTVSDIVSDGVTLASVGTAVEPMSVDVVNDCDTVSEDKICEEVKVIIPLTNVSVLVVTDRVLTIIVPVRMDGVAVEEPVNADTLCDLVVADCDTVSETPSEDDTVVSIGVTVMVTVTAVVVAELSGMLLSEVVLFVTVATVAETIVSVGITVE